MDGARRAGTVTDATTDPGSSIESARRELAAALDGVVLPEAVTTDYGERLHVSRFFEWLDRQDQPTKWFIAALLRSARQAGRHEAARR